MAANDVGIKITAVDDASGVFGKVASEAGKLQGAVAGVGTSLAALASAGALGLSALSFATKIKEVIDLGDSFNKLSQKTGVAVEELSKLNYAAGLSDVSTDTLAKGLKKLNISISEAANGGQKQADIFKALGINVKDASGNVKSADVVLASLAESFSKSADGANKTAVAVALLGSKTGDELIPLLNAGAAGLKSMGTEAQKLGIVLGADFAKNAEEFNDNLRRVQVSGQGLAITLAGDLVKGLGQTVSAMAAAGVEGGKLAAIIAGIQTLFTGTDQYKNDKALVDQTDKLLNLQNEIDSLKAGGSALDVALLRRKQEDLKVLQSQIDTTMAYRKQLQGLADDKAKAEVPKPTADSKAIKDAAAAASSGTASAALDAQAKAYKTWVAAINEKIAADRLEAEGGKKLTDGQKEDLLLRKAVAAGTISQKDASSAATKALLAERLAQEALADQSIKTVKATLDAAQARVKFNETLAGAVEKAQKETAAQQDYNDKLGLSKDAIAALDAAKLEDQAITLDGIAIKVLDRNLDTEQYELYKAQAAELRKLAALKKSGAAKETALDELKKTQDEAKKLGDQLENIITDGLMRGFENGKTFAENFRSVLENTFKTMVLRPTVSAIVNGVGNGALQSVSQAATSFAGSSLASSAGVLGSSGSLAAGTFELQLSSGAMEMLASASAAIPYVAAAVAAAALIDNLTNRPQGPQNTGVNSIFSSDGTLSSRYRPSASGTSSVEADRFTDGLAASFFASLKKYGATTSGVDFGFQSTTDNKFDLSTTVGGSVAFQQGRSDVSEAAIQLAASRAVFAALQASELPGYLSKAFDGLTAGTATQDQIAGAYQFADSLKAIRFGLLDTTAQMAEYQKIIDASTASLGTSATNFKTDFIAAIDAGLTPEGLTRWTALGGTMEALAQITPKTVEATKDLGKTLKQLTEDAIDAQKNLVEKYTAPLTQATASDVLGPDVVASIVGKSGNEIREMARVYAAGLDTQTEAGRAAITKLGTLTGAIDFFAEASDTAAQKAREAAEATAARNISLKDQLDLLTGATTQLEIDLRGVTDATTISLLNQIDAQQKLKTANEKTAATILDLTNKIAAATQAVASAQGNVASVRAEGTSAYISALGQVESAQQRIADLQLSAQQELAKAANDAAAQMADLGKQLREFVNGSQLKPSDNFARLLTSALGGDKDAMRGLSGAAGAAIDAAKGNATSGVEFARAQARIVAQVASVATLAELAGKNTVAVPGSADPLTAANQALVTAQTSLAEALRVANAIGAPLTASVTDLIKKFQEATNTLAVAQADLTKQQAALDAIQGNTAATTTAIGNLKFEIDAAALKAKLVIDAAVIATISSSELPAPLKTLALDTIGSLKKTVEAVITSTSLTDPLKQLGIDTVGNLEKTVMATVKSSDLTPTLKKLGLDTVGAIDTNVNAIITNSKLTDDLIAIGLGAAGTAATTITATIKSNIPVSDAAMTKVIEGAGSYVATVSSVLASNLSPTVKSILSDASAAASLAVTVGATLGSAITADQRLLLETTGQTIKRVVDAAVTGGSITADQLKIIDAANTTVSKTVQALIDESRLTPDQSNILKLISGATNGVVTVSVSGSVTSNTGTNSTVTFAADDPLRSAFNNISKTNELLIDGLQLQLKQLLGVSFNENLVQTDSFNKEFTGTYFLMTDMVRLQTSSDTYAFKMEGHLSVIRTDFANLRTEVQAVATQSKKTADILDRITQGGTEMRATVIA